MNCVNRINKDLYNTITYLLYLTQHEFVFSFNVHIFKGVLNYPYPRPLHLDRAQDRHCPIKVTDTVLQTLNTVLDF